MKKHNNIFIGIGAVLLSTNLLYADNTVVIKIPKVPEVPKVEAKVPQLKVEYPEGYKTNEEILQEFTEKKEIVFSDHVAPDTIKKQVEEKKENKAGDVIQGRLSAYLHAPYMEPKAVEESLKKAGFEILKTYKVDKKGLATAIIFTNKAIEDMAAKDARGFAASLRATVDKHNKLVSISNPLYMMKAFMQDQYNEKVAQDTLNVIHTSFNGLKNSEEIIKFNVLERFQFMEGMPRYKDMAVIKEAKNNDLYAKAKKSKKVVFEQKLSDGSVLLGVQLSKRTSKFVKKIGYQNAALLPYPVLIQNNQAKILDPKYYIAVMYPKLKMSQFMKISTIPGAINKEIGKIFR